MHEVVHILGNGDSAPIFDHSCKGTRLVCNLPPFHVDNVFASVMVDFKMMAALTEGSLNLDAYQWVLGNRPKLWMENQGSFYIKHGHRIKDFYLTVPKYCGPPGTHQAATNFNCGHMASHYAANKLKAKEIHLYGFDSLFDHNMRSITDLYLNSDRSDTNNYRLLNTWRPVWVGIFDEFKDTKFILHHKHDKLKLRVGDNVSVEVGVGK